MSKKMFSEKMKVQTENLEPKSSGCISCIVGGENCQGQCKTAAIAQKMRKTQGIVTVAVPWTPKVCSSG